MGIPAATLEREIESTLKGTSYVNLTHFVTTKYGNEKWEEVIEFLSPGDRDVVRSISAVGWYESAVFGRLLRAIDQTCGRGDLSLLHEVGTFEVNADFNRAIRIFFRVLEPATLFKIQGRLWSRYQSRGRWEIESVPHGVDGTLSDWVVDEAQCAELTGYLEGLIKLTGGKSVSVKHPECKGRGNSRCFFKARWE